MDDKDHSHDSASRDRDRSRRGEKPSRFSDVSRERDRSGDRDRGGRKSSNNRVYVSNISYEYRWQDLKDLFRNRVGEVSFVELFVDENDKPKGCGIVEFSDPASVKKCMEVMHRFDLKGRKLVIKEDFGNERDKFGNIINGRRRDRDMDDMRDRDRRDRRGNWDNNPPSLLSNMMNRSSGQDIGDKWGNTYGLSPHFLDSLGINKPLVNRVFVANLDYKVDEKKLREVFKLAGKVIDVELYHDKDGNSRGFAVVDYDHPVESVQAISMFHNQMLYDRPMTVRMDRVDHSDMPVRLPEGLKGIGMGLGVNGEPLREVSRNLPSAANASNSGSGNVPGMVGSGGAGILGAVPSQGLNSLGSALSNVVNPALAGLTGGSSALQGLSGVQNQFLANNLNDLGLANLNTASLVGNSLGQNPTLAALANTGLGGGGNIGGMGQNSSMSGPNYNRGDGSGNYHGSGSGGNPMNREYTSEGRDYDSSSHRPSSYDLPSSKSEYRDEYRQQSNPLYSTVNNGSQRMGNNKNYSDTILVTNLPSSVSYKTVREKFAACGDVQYMEMKGKDSAVIRFAHDWEAQRALQMLDRTRIDGRTIDIRYF